MTVAEFKSDLESFLQGLRAHQAAWRHAQGWPLSDVKRQALEEQAHRLARHLGRLRPYIYHFIGAPLWVMHIPSVPGSAWNALDGAVGTRDIAVVKGSSMDEVVSKLHQLLGRLDGMNPAEELPPPLITPKQTPVRPPQTAPMYSPKPQATARDPTPDPPSPAPPPRAAPSTPPEQPVTLDKLSLGELFAGLRRLSVPAAITVFGIIVALGGALIKIVGWMDQRSMDAMRDSVRVQQRVIDAERHRGDSLAAALIRRPPTRKTR
jgi:hypothetical protein